MGVWGASSNSSALSHYGSSWKYPNPGDINGPDGEADCDDVGLGPEGAIRLKTKTMWRQADAVR